MCNNFHCFCTIILISSISSTTSSSWFELLRLSDIWETARTSLSIWSMYPFVVLDNDKAVNSISRATWYTKCSLENQLNWVGISNLWTCHFGCSAPVEPINWSKLRAKSPLRILLNSALRLADFWWRINTSWCFGEYKNRTSTLLDDGFSSSTSISNRCKWTRQIC